MSKTKQQWNRSYHFLKMCHIDIARGRDSYSADAHTSHVRGRRVGTVRAHRDQADITASVTAELVITLDCAQSSVFTLCTTVKIYVKNYRTHEQTFNFQVNPMYLCRCIISLYSCCYY